MNKGIKLFNNKKLLLGILSLIVAVLLIVMCSVVPVIIDPNKWATTEFISDQIIICAIVIIAMVSTIMIGQAWNAGREDSELAKARVKFFNSVELIVNTSAFFQWVKQIREEEDLEHEKRNMLMRVGVNDTKVLNLSRSQLKALVQNPQKYDNHFFRQITKVQYKTIIDILNGKANIDFVDPQNYLFIKSTDTKATISKKMANEQKKKTSYLSLSIMGRLLCSLVVGMIFAGLAKDISQGNDTATIMIKLLSRLSSFTTSSFMGFWVGCQINDIEATYIQTKVLVQQQYLQEKDNFKAKTEEELAKEEYEKTQKEVKIDISKKEQIIVEKSDTLLLEEKPIIIMGESKE